MKNRFEQTQNCAVRLAVLPLLLLTLALTTLLSACSSQPRVDDFVVRTGDTKAIKVLELRTIQKSNLLTVQASLRNTGDQQNISYRFTWYGQGKLRLASDAWKPLILGPGQTDDVVGIAPSPEAVDFRFELISYQ